MKITLISLLFLLAACVPALCGKEELPVLQPQGPAETRSRFAALDDVRLLANGLLQLGQSLREFVQKTKGQINDIVQKLNIFDRSFYQLSVLASEIKEEEEELKKTTVVLMANNDEIKGLSVQINSKVDSILQEKSSLQNKLEGLEEKLSSLSHGLLTSKQVAEINSLRVSHLFSDPDSNLNSGWDGTFSWLFLSYVDVPHKASLRILTSLKVDVDRLFESLMTLRRSKDVLFVCCVIITLKSHRYFPHQEVIHTQEQSITELLKAVREQSDQLNLQNVKIKTLEEKVKVRDFGKVTGCGEGRSRVQSL